MDDFVNDLQAGELELTFEEALERCKNSKPYLASINQLNRIREYKSPI